MFGRVGIIFAMSSRGLVVSPLSATGVSSTAPKAAIKAVSSLLAIADHTPEAGLEVSTAGSY